MDYKEILKEQFDQVVDLDEIDEISRRSAELSDGLSEQFRIENILEATLNGESFFNNQGLISGVKDLCLYEIKSALMLGVEILIICIVIGLLRNLASSFEKKSMSDLSLLVCTMVIIGISINSFQLVYQLTIDAASTMINTMEILTPILLGILVATGSVTSGSILSPIIIGSITGFGIILKRMILPALFLATILGLINFLTEKDYVNKLAKLIRNASVVVTGLIIAILTGIITVQGLITETSDTLLMSTAKYSLSTFIPIVGGFTADTVELFLRCMGSIKNILGVFAMVTLILIILVPLIKILIIAVIYKLTAAVSEPICESKISDGLNEMGSCLISMASVLFFTALLFILFVSIIVRTGGA